MKVKFLGKSDPLGLANGQVYDVLSIDEGWYSIMDGTYEACLYPPKAFEVVEE